MRTDALKSLLFMPASNARALEKAKGLAADALVFDLEDAVGPDDKEAAREALRTVFDQRHDYGDKRLVVRINAPDTRWYMDDIAVASRADAILIPKVDDIATLELVARDSIDRPLWAMIETPLGVLMAAQIAGHSRVSALVVGTNDLAAEVGATVDAERSQLMMSLQSTLLAGRALGIAVFDGVYNNVRDPDGFWAEAQQGRALGFNGKSLIHPTQIEMCHKAFLPSEQDLSEARALIKAYEDAGKGVATFRGKMIEDLHVRTARHMIARSA